MGAVIRVAGIEVRGVEIQVQAVNAADRRRPAEPVVADAGQRAAGIVAVARTLSGKQPLLNPQAGHRAPLKGNRRTARGPSWMNN